MSVSTFFRSSSARLRAAVSVSVLAAGAFLAGCSQHAGAETAPAEASVPESDAPAAPAADAGEPAGADTIPGPDDSFPAARTEPHSGAGAGPATGPFGPAAELFALDPGTPAPEPRPSVAWTEATLPDLTLRQKVGQMLMPQIQGGYTPEGTEAHRRVVSLVEDNEVGGVIMSVGTPTDVALKLNELHRRSRVPLLVGSDLESGPGFRFDGAVHLPGMVELGGATRFPPLMALGAIGDERYAYEVGRVTAIEARALGVHLPFAPVLDVNNNPANPVINVRSFGEDPRLVARLGAAFVRGVRDHDAVPTGKHFPGHGDTKIDSHVELPVIPVSRARLDSIELVPFRAALDAGMDAIMTAHVAVPRLASTTGTPATLAPGVIDDLLRREMGFDGLVITDAMDMRAITRKFPRGESAVRAVEAGADVVLMPPSVDEAQSALVAAVRSGRLSEQRIDASVRRILALKERLELHRYPAVRPEEIRSRVGVPAHTDLAQEIADRSITLLRNDGNLLPLLGTRSAEVLSVTYRGRHDLLAGRRFDDRLRDRYPRLRTAHIDRDTPDAVYERLAERAAGADLVLVSLYSRAVANERRSALPDELADFVAGLRHRGIPHAAVSFGNPYVIEEIPDVQAYLLAWGGGAVSQRAAARALFGDVELRGRLPIEIPPFFAIGDGLKLGVEELTAGGG